MTYKIPIFLSYPKPFNRVQAEFVNAIENYLASRDLAPRTLGVTDYDMQEPLTAIRRLMLECNGLITIALRRTHVNHGIGNPSSDIGREQYVIDDRWLTSPYCQIEPAMAFQIGLPVLILREKGVIADGLLEKGVIGTYMPEIDLAQPIEPYLKSTEWRQIVDKWEAFVRQVVENKGKPPKLY